MFPRPLSASYVRVHRHGGDLPLDPRARMGRMARFERLLAAPIGFAHRGARAHSDRENTIEAFRTAIDMGATGLESDVWLSSDGEPVLDHDGIVGGWLRRRPFGSVA